MRKKEELGHSRKRRQDIGRLLKWELSLSSS